MVKMFSLTFKSLHVHICHPTCLLMFVTLSYISKLLSLQRIMFKYLLAISTKTKLGVSGFLQLQVFWTPGRTGGATTTKTSEQP